jgi:NADPH:quinone reductase-like Zn-dependent oxidoreductase
MKAIVYYRYGSPDVLRLEEVEKPTPVDGEVLIQIHAAWVNAPDWRNVRANPFLMRLTEGFLRPKNHTLGLDIAGRVEAVGRDVQAFQPDDEVWGDLYDCGLGAFAEFKAMPEDGALGLKPANLSFEEAAAVPSAGVTALQGLRHMGEIRPGQKVLINGASGGIGTFAVQIAKSFGAEVTGVCSSRNLELVSSIGADEVIDYTDSDYADGARQWDLILDIAVSRSLRDNQRALTSEGAYVMVGFSMFRTVQLMLQGPRITAGRDQTMEHMGEAKTNKEDLSFLKELLEAGKVAPVIDRRYTLDEVPEAIRYYEKGHARGKVVIQVVNPATT